VGAGNFELRNAAGGGKEKNKKNKKNNPTYVASSVKRTTSFVAQWQAIEKGGFLWG